MMTRPAPLLRFKVNSSNKVDNYCVFLSIGLMVFSLFFWMFLYSQTVHVAEVSTKSIQTVPVLRASQSTNREEESGMSRQESVEDRDDAAKKRDMDLESTKQNRIQSEFIINNSASLLHKSEHLVNQTPAQYRAVILAGPHKTGSSSIQSNLYSWSKAGSLGHNWTWVTPNMTCVHEHSAACQNPRWLSLPTQIPKAWNCAPIYVQS